MEQPETKRAGEGGEGTGDGQRQKDDEFPNWAEMMFFSGLRRAARA